tara:strand:+ start:6971 stop:7462 length:492 start_codon:yes stop_codon:yes gene_type:complete
MDESMLKDFRRTPWSDILNDEEVRGIESTFVELQEGKVSPYVLPGIMVMRKIRAETIVGLVCGYLGMKEEDLFQKSRQRKIIYARSLCYVLLKEFNISACSTFMAIGKFFRKDHTTVLHSYYRVKGYATVYPDVSDDISNLMALTRELLSRAEGSSIVIDDKN